MSKELITSSTQPLDTPDDHYRNLPLHAIDIQPGVSPADAAGSYANSRYDEINGDPERIQELITPFYEKIEGRAEDIIQVTDPSIIERIKRHRLGKGTLAIIAGHEGAWDQNWLGAMLEHLGLGAEALKMAVAAKADDYFVQGNRETLQRAGAVHTFRSHIYGEAVAKKATKAFNKTFVMLATIAEKNLMIFPHGTRTSDPNAPIKSGTGYIIHSIQNAGDDSRDVGILDARIEFSGDPNTTPPKKIVVGNFHTGFPDDPDAINKYVRETLGSRAA